MSRDFVEMVISAPFILVKGFLMGLIEGSKEQPLYFFSKRTGIRTETLGSAFKEWLGFENIVHLCLDKKFSRQLSAGIEHTYEKLGMEVKSVKHIESAGFGFKSHFFKKDEADEFQAYLDALPKGVYLDGFKEDEHQDKDHDGEAGAYAPSHAYEYTASGRVVGDFAGVVEVFLKYKNDILVDTDGVELNFAAL
ncbi:MAG: hypothetical protein KAH24_02270 [Holophagae bacterium]|nr:hypothetical protein [Holophagae bacterium]